MARSRKLCFGLTLLAFISGIYFHYFLMCLKQKLLPELSSTKKETGLQNNIKQVSGNSLEMGIPKKLLSAPPIHANEATLASESHGNMAGTQFQHIQYWANDGIYANINCVSDHNMTSEQYSTVRVIKTSRLTGKIEVQIRAYDGRNVPKTRGGDIFLLWAEQDLGDGRVAADVIDNLDGSYTGFLHPFWFGRTIVRAKLGGTIENMCIRRKSLLKYGTGSFSIEQPVVINGTFKNGDLSESALCGTEHTIYGYENVCNLTDLNDNNQWFCGKPLNSQLKCSNIFSFNTFRQEFNWQDKDQIRVFGYGKIYRPVFFITQRTGSLRQYLPCHTSPKASSWTYGVPSGFHMNKTWHMFYCKHSVPLRVDSYRQCLRNKTVILLGDSTVRQYAEFLIKEVLVTPGVNLKEFRDGRSSFHPQIVFKKFGITVIYKNHEMPLHGKEIYAKGITSIATEIEKLAKNNISGTNLVVFAGYGSHLQAYPPERYRERIRNLVSPIKKLHKAKPKAMVFIKGPHVYFLDKRWFDLRISLINKDILFQEFEELQDKVVYLDLWSLTAAMENYALHPTDDILSLQMQQFLSYICSV